jgi:hypothetical protein
LTDSHPGFASLVQGTIVKLVAKKKEIYVKDAAGKKHEFYFTDKASVTAAGSPPLSPD